VVQGTPRPLRTLIGVAGRTVGRVVYALEVVFREGEFQPVAMPRMPHHHGSRFEWHGVPASARPELDRRYVFDFIVTEVDIRQVPGRREWRATYHARVEDVHPSR